MPTPASPPFLGQPRISTQDIQPGDLVIPGVCEATPYIPGQASHAAGGPMAVRRALAKYAGWTGHYDFDFGGQAIGGSDRRIVDIGDLDGDPDKPEKNRDRIANTVARIIDARGTPLVIGGDDSAPIAMNAGFDAQAPFHIVQIDAHLDWRNERKGITRIFLNPPDPARRAGHIGVPLRTEFRRQMRLFTPDGKDLKQDGAGQRAWQEPWGVECRGGAREQNRVAEIDRVAGEGEGTGCDEFLGRAMGQDICALTPHRDNRPNVQAGANCHKSPSQNRSNPEPRRRPGHNRRRKPLQDQCCSGRARQNNRRPWNSVRAGYQVRIHGHRGNGTDENKL